MGKARRLRRQQKEPSSRPSAWALFLEVGKETVGIPELLDPSYRIQKLIYSSLPMSRVYRYRDWSIPEIPIRELGSQLRGVCFPFPVTLLDLTYELVELGRCLDNSEPLRLVGILGMEESSGEPIAVALCARGQIASRRWLPVAMPLFSLGNSFMIDETRSIEGLGQFWPQEATETLGKALLTLLAMLECVNIDVLPALDPPRRGHIANGIPHYEVLVRQRSTRRQPPDERRKINWSHRWEVAANFAHYTHGPIFDGAEPERRILHPDHGECVRVWRPSHVKGPPDKPLLPKVRIVT